MRSSKPVLILSLSKDEGCNHAGIKKGPDIIRAFFIFSRRRKAYAAFFSSMPSTRLTAVGSSVFSTAATSRAMRARAAS